MASPGAHTHPAERLAASGRMARFVRGLTRSPVVRPAGELDRSAVGAGVLRQSSSDFPYKLYFVALACRASKSSFSMRERG